MVATAASTTSPIDVAVGLVALTLGAVRLMAGRAKPVLLPVARLVLRPPMVPERLQLGEWLASVGRRGGEHRTSYRYDASRLLDVLVPAALEEVLHRIDLTTLIRSRVDLDAVVEGVDLDAVAARLDVASVVDRVDLDAVAARLDIEAVLDRLDLTAVVLQRVDMDAVIEDVLKRIDLTGLAQEVIDSVDLPEIIRESTGSMASDTVRGARMQGIAADEAVGRLIDRLLLRRSHRPNEAANPSLPPDRPTSGAPGQPGPRRSGGSDG